MRHIPVTFINASGLYYNSRFKPILESTVNLCVSIVALRYYGIAGIFFGTFVSYVVGSIWIEPYILYKHWFKKSALDYFKKYIHFFLLTVLVAFITGLICNGIDDNSRIGLLKKTVICLFFPNLVFYILFRKPDEFSFYLKKFKRSFDKI